MNKKLPKNSKKTSGTSRTQKWINRTKKHSLLGTVVRSIFIIFVATFIIICGYVLGDCIATVNGDAFDLDTYKADQDQTSIIYSKKTESAEYTELMRLHGETNRIWVGLDEIPKNMVHAVVALEDKRFYEHKGVDWVRTIGVMVKYNFEQGGSTITQQLIKNLTDKKDVTFVRKYNEILTALNLEKNYDKNEIIETYLNTLYLGEGCYGIKTAAEVYFGKEVQNLNLAECAVLASITQAPGTYDPLVNPENNKERQELCLKKMLEQEYISEEEYNEAVSYKLVYSNSPGFVSQIKKEDKSQEENSIQSFYVDYIIEKLIQDFQEKEDLTPNQAYRKVYYGGLRIYSAENTEVQKALEEMYESRSVFPDTYGVDSNNKKVQSAMTIMDYKGRVVAIVGQADEKAGNRCLNRATQSPRQPGSIIKPLSAYAPAMDKEIITWGTRYLDYSGTRRNGSLWPENYGGSTGSGSYVSASYALMRSLNTVPYRILTELGLSESYDFFKNKLHMSYCVDGKDDNDYAPMTVGAMTRGTTSLEMTAAFAIFGSGGVYYEPYPYYKVTNSDGSKVYFDNTNPQGEQVIGRDTAECMNKMLQKVVSGGGTGSAYGINGFTTFAKTGTTTDDNDRWFAGGTPYYVSAIWYGFDMPRSIVTSASNPAGYIFKKVYDNLHSNLKSKDFDYKRTDNGDGSDTGAAKYRAYCTYTGMLAGSGCYSTSYGWFKSDYNTYCSGNHSGYYSYSGSGGSGGSYNSSGGNYDDDDDDDSDYSSTNDVTSAPDITDNTGGGDSTTASPPTASGGGETGD